MDRPPRTARGLARPLATLAGLLAAGALALIPAVPATAVPVAPAGGGLRAAAPVAAAPVAAPPVAAAPATPISPATPTPGAHTFGVQPAGKDKPDARSWFTYSATPGATLADHLAVHNYGTAPLTLRVYAADAFNTADGGLDVLPSGRRSTAVGAWLSTGAPQLTIPAKGMVIVPFRLAIPANATPGDHVGGLVAAVRTTKDGGQGKKVVVEDRVGVRVYLRVAGQLHGELKVEEFHAGYTGTLNPLGHGSVAVNYVIHNVGNLRLSGHQTIRVAGWFGQATLASGLPEVPELLPGSSLRVSTVVPDVFPAVRLAVTGEVDPRPQPGDSDPLLQPAVHATSLLTIPWTLGALLVALVGAAGLVRRRRRPARPGPAAAVPAGTGGRRGPTSPPKPARG